MEISNKEVLKELFWSHEFPESSERKAVNDEIDKQMQKHLDKDKMFDLDMMISKAGALSELDGFINGFQMAIDILIGKPIIKER